MVTLNKLTPNRVVGRFATVAVNLIAADAFFPLLKVARENLEHLYKRVAATGDPN